MTDHREDVWGIALLTVAALGILALYADALGPVGHGARHALGAVLGVGRFFVPPAFALAGVMLVTGRPQHEPGRTGVGLVLALAAVAGLADLAGGAPKMSASSARLSGAGGWIGVAMGNPLRSGLGNWGASVVLLALCTLACVLFTGVTLRTALSATGAPAPGCGGWPSSAWTRACATATAMTRKKKKRTTSTTSSTRKKTRSTRTTATRRRSGTTSSWPPPPPSDATSSTSSVSAS